MTLNEWASRLKAGIYEDLLARRAPREGQYDEAALREAQAKGEPKAGPTVFSPRLARFEFIFSNPDGAANVVPVTVEPPQRIVFLPVPGWVVESIWQGEVDGSYHFESDADSLLAAFASELDATTNAKYFGPRPAKRRE
ncbi:MAG: hypothetical protein JSS66_12115 [Armatimonadetes bacterium]|nr:hypothetical protein [Armatimonadota bacterium]